MPLGTYLGARCPSCWNSQPEVGGSTEGSPHPNFSCVTLASPTAYLGQVSDHGLHEA